MNINKKVYILLLVSLFGLSSCNQTQFFEKEYLQEEFNGDVDDTDQPSSPAVNNPEPKAPVEDPNEVPKEEPKEDPQVPLSPEPSLYSCEAGKVLKNIEEKFKQNETKEKKLDILWVVDNSVSMKDEQEALAYNFELFIEKFITRGIDFQMGIVSTDGRNSKAGKFEGDFYKLSSNFANKEPSAFIESFKNMIKLGTNGSSTERGLYTSTKFFENYKNFVRDEAHLVTLYVSDEEDQSKESVLFYQDLLQSLKSEKGKFQAHSIVKTEPKKQGNFVFSRSYSGSESEGSRYIELSKNTGGLSASIDEDFYESLNKMGGSILELLNSFSIKGEPIEKSIKVYVNEIESFNDWSFESITKNIKFLEGETPLEGSDILVRYQQCI